VGRQKLPARKIPVVKKHRYVARQYSGRTWSSVSIIDTETFEATVLPESEEVLAMADFEATTASYMSEFEIDNWLSETGIKINFGWSTENNRWIQGSYHYSIPANSFTVVEIEETEW